MLAQRTIRTVNDASYKALVTASHDPVMVCYFSSESEADDSVLQDVEAGSEGRFTVVQSLLREAPQSAMQNGVVMTPAYMIFSNGNKRAVAVGHLGADDLKRFVQRALD